MTAAETLDRLWSLLNAEVQAERKAQADALKAKARIRELSAQIQAECAA